MKNLKNKFRELKIESNREDVKDVNYMGKESASRTHYHEQRRRRESQNREWPRIRRDSQGRDFYQERRGRNDSRGRPFFRRYYRGESRNPRDFSRDMRSFSWNGSNGGGYRNRSSSRGENGRDGNGRNKSVERSGERNMRCTACKCEICRKKEKKVDELGVNLCEGYNLDEEYLVNYMEKSKQVMILDIGAPVSLVGKGWIEKYLEEHEVRMEDLNRERCEQIFRFGPSRKYVSMEMVELPMLVKMMDGKEEVLRVVAYVVDADVPFLLGKKTMEGWKSKLDTVNKVLETEMEGKRKNFRMVDTGSNPFGIEIEKKSRKLMKSCLQKKRKRS